MMALISNTFYSGNYNVAAFAAQNLAVIPLLAVAIAATVFRQRWVQVAAPFILTAIWAFYLADLQGALH
jgi:hypothetical protein